MEENRQILELLERMEKNSRRQLRLGRIQCILTLVAAAFCAAAFLLVLRALPQVMEVLPRIDGVLGQMQTVLGNLETTTQQLAQIDLTGMVTDVDALVTTAQESLNQTMQKMDAIDLTTLNKAIGDLATVVEPLSKLLKAFS